MTNGYFSSYTPLPRHQNARAEAVNAIFDAVIVGFDGVPAAAGIQQDRVTHCTDTGAADTYVIAPATAILSYVAGQHFTFVAVHANTMASTVNVSTLGVKTIKRQDGADLSAGDIALGQVVDIRYDGTNFQLMSVPSGSVAAAAASATAAASSATAAASSASAASTSASAAATSATAAAASAGTFNVSTRQVLTSGSSATYTRPSGPAPRQLRIRLWGGGGAGASNSSNAVNGGSGGDTIFNGVHASGGVGGTNGGSGGAGGTGGTGSASLRVPGNGGGAGINIGTGFGTSGAGGQGGAGPLGGSPTNGNNAAANTGAGGFGGAGSSFNGTLGGGGGSSEYVEYIINSPAGTYTYTIGAGGTTTSAPSFGFGCNGGSGQIIVEEIY